MMDFIMSVANDASTPWWVLSLAGLIVAVEAFRSNDALWSDMFAEDEE